MKTKHLFTSLTTFCAAAALVGCASADRQASRSSFDEKNLDRNGVPSAAGVSQPAILHESAFQKPDLNAEGAISLDQRQQLHATAVAKENCCALDEDDEGQINVAEFVRQAPTHSDLHHFHFLGDTDKTNDGYSSWDTGVFQQQGLRLLSIHF